MISLKPLLKIKGFAILFLVLSACTACLKETPYPVTVSFEYQYAENNQTVPAEITIVNRTKGADFYEWTFEGASPNASSDKNPQAVYFDKAGTYRIKLKAWNSVSSAEKEMEVRIDSALFIDFEYNIEINDFVPAEIKITNKSRGAISYEWNFEGGEPSRSSSPNPGTIKYNNPGEFKIELKATNGSKENLLTKTFNLRLSPSPDFEITPFVVDKDMEAPLSAILKRKSESGIAYKWECVGATIKEKGGTDEAEIRFPNPGTFTVRLLADNKKEVQVKEKQITVKPNSGIYSFRDIKLGVNEARHTIGSLFSASHQRVLTTGELADLGDNNKIDFGFFGINSGFEYCYFFSPHQSEEAGFGEIASAQSLSIMNLPKKYGVAFTEQDFENIRTADNFTSVQIVNGDSQDYFDSTSTPLFVLFETADKRKGVIKVKSFNRQGTGSYILTDIKMEKRRDE